MDTQQFKADVIELEKSFAVHLSECGERAKQLAQLIERMKPKTLRYWLATAAIGSTLLLSTAGGGVWALDQRYVTVQNLTNVIAVSRLVDLEDKIFALEALGEDNERTDQQNAILKRYLRQRADVKAELAK